MTEVQDRERLVELKPPPASLRRTLVARALRPTRKSGSREVATKNAPVELRAEDPFDIEPKSRFSIIRWSFALVVVLPILLSGVYLFAFASNIYVSETRFAVRKVQSDSGGSDSGGDSGGKSGGGSSPLLGSASNIGGDDAEIVANYVHSRAIIEDISRTVDVRAIFSRPEADFWARLSPTTSIEDLTAYWNRMVSVYIEGSSGIVSVSASAFRREDALALTKAILAASDRLVNTISRQILIDASRQAEDEVRRSEGEVRFSMAEMTAFRNSKHLIDPVEEAKSNNKLLFKLMSEKIQSESAVFIALRNQGPNAPGLSVAKDKLASITKQIKDLQEQMAGNDEITKNMAATMAAFEELELKKKFAERMYGFARDGVERARVAAMQQSIYLAPFVAPSLPEDYSFPLRGTDFVLIALAALMFWLSGLTITASILDHRL